jgi:hypothetical protein
MAQLEKLIKELVLETVAELGVGSASPPVELITIEAASQICDCDKSVINSLMQEAETNGFPVVHLGKRTIRIDKHRLNTWLRSGGLNGTHQQDRREKVSHPRFQRVG